MRMARKNPSVTEKVRVEVWGERPANAAQRLAAIPGFMVAEVECAKPGPRRWAFVIQRLDTGSPSEAMLNIGWMLGFVGATVDCEIDWWAIS